MGTNSEMERAVSGLPSKSAKIRALASAGYRRADIARFMDVKYQFVRNVLEASRQKSMEMTPPASAGGASSNSTSRSRLKVGRDGSVLVLPDHIRDEMGMREGDSLIASVEDGELRLYTVAAAVRRAQALIRKYVPEGTNLVDELLEDRRREAERERQS